MESVQINTNTFLDVYTEEKYILVRRKNNPSSNKQIPFNSIMGYDFYWTTKNQPNGEIVIRCKDEDIKVRFTSSYEIKAQEIEPYLETILGGKPTVDTNKRKRSVQRKNSCSIDNELRKQIISELKCELKKQKENNISSDWTKWLKEMAVNYGL